MVTFTLTPLRDGVPLGGHNVQCHVGTATGRHAPPDDVDVWLESGWWISFRNQFAQAPDSAAKIIASVEPELSDMTYELEQARGSQMATTTRKLSATTFEAIGSHYWR